MSVIISIHFNWYVRETIKANNRNATEKKTDAEIKARFFVLFCSTYKQLITMHIEFKPIGPKVFAIEVSEGVVGLNIANITIYPHIFFLQWHSNESVIEFIGRISNFVH